MGDAAEQVMQLLCTANTSQTWDGRVRWHLDAADICCLLELGHELSVDAEQSNQLFQELQHW
jgi:hypothetical protein